VIYPIQFLSKWGQKKLLKKIAISFIAVFFLVATLTGVWFLRNGEFMKIVHFEVLGTSMVSPEDIIALMQSNDVLRNELIGFILPQNHILAYHNNEVLVNIIKKRFPRVKEAIIARDYQNRSISVYITERNNQVIWCSTNLVMAGRPSLHKDKHCFWLDNTGVVIGRAPYSHGTLIPVIIDQTGRDIFLGRTLILQDKLTNLLSAIEMLEGFNWTITEIIINDAEFNELVITIDTGQKLFINILRDLQAEGRAILNTLVVEQKWPRIESVDLRIDGKGFYKLR